MLNTRNPERLSRHLEQIVRSRHYTWLGEGLGGEPLELALELLLADVQHICQHEHMDFEGLVARSRERFEIEEAAFHTTCG